MSLSKIWIGDLTIMNVMTKALVGVPLPYPSNTVPPGCLKMDGSSFNKSSYPILAKVYPSGKLPDLRGMFIRGHGGNSSGLLVKQLGSLAAGFDESGDNAHIYHIYRTNSREMGYDLPNDYLNKVPDDVEVLISNPGDLASNVDEWVCRGLNDFIRRYPNGPEGNYGIPCGITRPTNMAFNYICIAM